ncbi:unnamed protein product [Lymnaea stagnalis]|uniref:Uncharacterized protein n=1 Tax=Lymnaea stagnalis TaxID=6523 RepID=A0AAV2I7J4_LYMST
MLNKQFLQQCRTLKLRWHCLHKKVVVDFKLEPWLYLWFSAVKTLSTKPSLNLSGVIEHFRCQISVKPLTNYLLLNHQCSAWVFNCKWDAFSSFKFNINIENLSHSSTEKKPVFCYIWTILLCPKNTLVSHDNTKYSDLLKDNISAMLKESSSDIIKENVSDIDKEILLARNTDLNSRKWNLCRDRLSALQKRMMELLSQTCRAIKELLKHYKNGRYEDKVSMKINRIRRNLAAVERAGQDAVREGSAGFGVMSEVTPGQGENVSEVPQPNAAPGYNQTREDLIFLRMLAYRRQINRDADSAYLCLVFLMCLMMMCMYLLRGFHNRNTQKKEVCTLDTLNFPTVKEVVFRKAKYLPMFNRDNSLTEVLVHDCGTNP